LIALLLASGLVASAGPLRAATFSVVGTGDGLAILEAIASAYGKKYPGEVVLIPPSVGSGGGIAAVGAGRERIGRVARPLSASEVTSGIAYVPIFDIPTVFYVQKGVPVRSLTEAQLTGIFKGEIVNWKDVGGPDMRVRVVRREDADSSVLVFREALASFKTLVFTERSKMALTTQDALSSIRDNEGAIGFGPYSTQTAGELGVIAIGGVAPTDARYPARVTLALIYKRPMPDPDIDRFVTFFSQPEARDIITRMGAIPVAK
jgi:phosphate transport system substrate-binding protein